MAERSGGGGFGWFIVGVLAGIALTLGGLAFLNLHGARSRHYEASSGADEAAASVSPAGIDASRAPIAPAPSVAPAAKPHATAPEPSTAADQAATQAAAQAADDAQMQEDAAAAGNTSRAKPPE